MDEERRALVQLKQGDIKALEPLVRSYYFEAVRSAFLIIGDLAQAEDIVQSEFLSLGKKIQSFDLQRSFRPWFMRCVVNSTLNKRRRNQRLLSLDAALETNSLRGAYVSIAEEVDPESEAEASELRQSVWNALERLSPAQRAAIVLRYYLELSEAEMAASMDAPTSSIKWWLHSAKQRLRELFIPEKSDRGSGQSKDREQSYG